MSLFDVQDQRGEDADDTKTLFPTLPAFTVPVKIQDCPQYGDGHKGIVALKPIPANTKFWIWTDRVNKIHHSELMGYLEEQTRHISDVTEKRQAQRIILRQGFVLPSTETSPNQDDYFNTNPTDAGRFMNHSSNPNCGPDGTLRDIQAGEEMTMDYSFHGNPMWYESICHQFDVETESEIAAAFSLCEEFAAASPYGFTSSEAAMEEFVGKLGYSKFLEMSTKQLMKIWGTLHPDPKAAKKEK